MLPHRHVGTWKRTFSFNAPIFRSECAQFFPSKVDVLGLSPVPGGARLLGRLHCLVDEGDQVGHDHRPEGLLGHPGSQQETWCGKWTYSIRQTKHCPFPHKALNFNFSSSHKVFSTLALDQSKIRQQQQIARASPNDHDFTGLLPWRPGIMKSSYSSVLTTVVVVACWEIHG